MIVLELYFITITEALCKVYQIIEYIVTGIQGLWYDGAVLSSDLWSIWVLPVQRHGVVDRRHQDWAGIREPLLATLRPTNCLFTYSGGTHEVIQQINQNTLLQIIQFVLVLKNNYSNCLQSNRKYELTNTVLHKDI